jgi:hypothetical protein
MKIKKQFLFLFSLIALLLTATPALAGNISVSPMFIDYVTEARDIKEEFVKIKNHGSTPMRIYASVNEISLGTDGQIKEFVTPMMTDRTSSVTSWIEISRGRNAIPPGGEIEIPFTIRINPNAKPGKYQVFVGFANAKNRDKAEAQIMAGQGDGVVVRITIDEKQSEFMRLMGFVTDRFMLNRGDQGLSYEVKNTGDVTLTPTGEVIFYDSRGHELSSIPLNVGGKEILPGETTIFEEKVPDFKKIGRNKAFMTLEYGEINKAAVYDTVYFYSMPLPYMIGILVLLIIVILAVTMLIHRATRLRHIDHHDDVHDVSMYVRDGHHDREEKDHDLNLKQKDE